MARIEPKDNKNNHDGLGRRVGKKVNGVLSQGYLYDSQDRLLALTDASGVITRTFGYTDQAHSYSEYDFRFTGNGFERFIPQNVIKDIRSTPVVVLQQGINGTLNPFSLGERDEWGSFISGPQGSFIGAPFGYAGCLVDSTPPTTPFCHFGARDYDPVVGRWLQRDPIGHAGGINLHQYALGDPVNNIDPSGLGPESEFRKCDTPICGGGGAQGFTGGGGGGGKFRLRDVFDIFRAFFRGNPTCPKVLTGNAVTSVPSINITFGHGARHLTGTGLTQTQVEGAITSSLRQQLSQSPFAASGLFQGRVIVGGRIIQFNAYGLPDGTINVGTYFPK